MLPRSIARKERSEGLEQQLSWLKKTTCIQQESSTMVFYPSALSVKGRILYHEHRICLHRKSKSASISTASPSTKVTSTATLVRGTLEPFHSILTSWSIGIVTYSKSSIATAKGMLLRPESGADQGIAKQSILHDNVEVSQHTAQHRCFTVIRRFGWPPLSKPQAALNATRIKPPHEPYHPEPGVIWEVRNEVGSY